MTQLSIIVPVKNQKQHLLSLLSMLSRCDLTNCEIVIVDNSDEAMDIHHLTIPDLDIRYFHKTNSNISKNLNTGIKLANGQFIARIDSHVILQKDYFSNAIKILNVHPDINLIGGYTEIVNQKIENNLATRLYSSMLSFGRSRYKINEITKFIDVKTNKIYLGVYRRCLFDEMKFNEDIERRQDGEFNSKIKVESCLLTPKLRLKYILIHDEFFDLLKRSFNQGRSLTKNRKNVQISHMFPLFFYFAYLILAVLYPLQIIVLSIIPFISLSYLYFLETRCNTGEAIRAPLLIFLIHIYYLFGIFRGLIDS